MGEISIFLDTNAVRDLQDPGRKAHGSARSTWSELLAESVRLDPTNLERPFEIVALVLYELERGLRRSGASAKLRRLRQFRRTFIDVVEFEQDDAEVAAELEASRVPRHNDSVDMMILGTAVAYESALITGDLKLRRWAEASGIAGVFSWEEVHQELLQGRAEE